MNNLSLSTIADLRTIPFPFFPGQGSELFIYSEHDCVPFDIKRVFVVKSSKDVIRGRHAHKKCTQLLVSLTGVVEVRCDDGERNIEYELENSSMGLLIPPGIWSNQKYLAENNTMMVICDEVYQENDYIRDYQSFLRMKRVEHQA